MNILEQFKKALNMDTPVPAAVDAANVPQPDAPVTTAAVAQDPSTDQQVTQNQSASYAAGAALGAALVAEVQTATNSATNFDPNAPVSVFAPAAVVAQPTASATAVTVDPATTIVVPAQNTQVAAVTAAAAPKSLSDLGKDLVTLESDIQTFIGSKAEFISSYVDRRFKQIRVTIEEEAVKEFETIKKTKQKAITDLEADWSATVSWVSTKFSALKGKL